MEHIEFLKIIEIIPNFSIMAENAYLCLMSGIYVHIPFCRRKCNYCNFYSTPAAFDAKVFTDLILVEARLRRDFFGGLTLSTIYLGGGTPGLLQPEHTVRLIEELMNIFDFISEPEITIELNPDDVNREWVRKLRKTQINRISLGVQSFSTSALNYLERLHSREQSENALHILIDAGYHNLSADLIYGIPGVSRDNLLSDIQKLTELNIPHISAYNLTVEPSTRLEMQIRQKQRAEVSSDDGAEAFTFLVSELQNKGYLHYEISNFCLPSYFSKHNTAYWKGEAYLGLGPSAHSFRNNERSWNISNIKKYSDALRAGETAYETETLTLEDEYNEFVMTRLRTMWGCSLNEIETRFGRKFGEYSLQQAEQWLRSGRMFKIEDVLYLTSEAKLFADSIASSMFFSD